MKIAALMPLRIDREKTMLGWAMRDIERVCDEFIVLHDRPDGPPPGILVPFVEEMIVNSAGDAWDDWSNRATLLVRAAKFGCAWAMQLDDDETLGPSWTRERVHQLCEEAEASGFVQIICKVRTVWDEQHYRTDGVFANQHKTFLLKNPFMLKEIKFEFDPQHRLHHFPNLEGPKMFVDDFILHHGMRTRSMREKNVAKYAAADPENKFSSVKYDYLLSTEGMTLEPL